MNVGLSLNCDATEMGSHEFVGERIVGPMLTGIRAASSGPYAISNPAIPLVTEMKSSEECTYAVSSLLWWLAVQALSIVLSSVG
jgi:hypothetical protein